MPDFLMIALTALLAWQSPPKSPDILAPYYPTPELVVRRLLDFGGLKPGETMFDLGSGDGRIVFLAAQLFRANAIGVELDNDLARQSIERLHKLGLDKTARIIH